MASSACRDVYTVWMTRLAPALAESAASYRTTKKDFPVDCDTPET